MVQGLSLGGEYGSSATYLSEMAGSERRGFWSSFQYVTLIAGQLLALALLLLLQAAMGEAALEGVGLADRLRAGRGPCGRRLHHSPAPDRDIAFRAGRGAGRGAPQVERAGTSFPSIRARHCW